jgi:hypothetical protein
MKKSLMIWIIAAVLLMNSLCYGLTCTPGTTGASADAAAASGSFATLEDLDAMPVGEKIQIGGTTIVKTTDGWKYLIQTETGQELGSLVNKETALSALAAQRGLQQWRATASASLAAGTAAPAGTPTQLTSEQDRLVKKLAKDGAKSLSTDELKKLREVLSDVAGITGIDKVLAERQQIDDTLSKYYTKGKLDKDKLIDAINKGEVDIKNLIALAKSSGDDMLFTLQITQYRAYRVQLYDKAEQNRMWARKYFAWLKPGPEAAAIANELNKLPLLKDFNYDLLRQGSEAWKKLFGFGISGYEHAICDAYFGSPPALQDYPGHYIGGGSMPDLGIASLHLEGRKTAYKSSDPGSKGWFYEARDDGTKIEKGYLYKISWNFVNPYSLQQYEAMAQNERESLGLQENGTIGYNIKIKGKDPDGNQIEFYLYKEFQKAGPQIPQGDALSFYKKSDFTSVAIEFEKGYKYDWHGTSIYSVDFQPQDMESNIPPDFEYFPAEAETAVTYTTPSGTEPIPADCDQNQPVSLCSIE